MPEISKKLILDLMPFIAFAIWVVGMFLPFAIGDIAAIGFGAGLALRVILPYYMSWKQNNELLVFNYAYLMPILVLVATTVVAGIGGVTEYLTLNLGTANPQILYIFATIFAYGGYAMLNGWKKWIPFLDGLFQKKQLDLMQLIAALSEESVEEEVLTEEPIVEPIPAPDPIELD